MSCSRCPHHVKHGQLDKNTNDIHFHQLCALKVKKANDTDFSVNKKKNPTKPKAKETVKKELLVCDHYPFDPCFNHLSCLIYLKTFKIQTDQNNVVPRSAYNETIESVSVTDMELL